MKTIILLFTVLSFTTCLAQEAQRDHQIDSLKRMLAASKEDTTKVKILVQLSFCDFEHTKQWLNKGQNLASTIKYEKGRADCLHQLGNIYWGESNNAMALYYYLDALKIREQIYDKAGMVSSFFCVGFIYQEQSDYKNAIVCYRKAESLHSGDMYRLALIHAGFGDVYFRRNKLDSALMYYNRSREDFNLSKNKLQFYKALNGLANVELKMGNKETALGFYRQAIKNGYLYSDTLGLSHTYINIAKYFFVNGQNDSSVLYARFAIFFSQKANVLHNIIESGKLLSKLYEHNDTETSLHYLQVSSTANDSLFGRERRMQINYMLFSEIIRQKQVKEMEEKKAEDRRHKIIYSLIALGIVFFVLLFILISRRYVINPRIIKFFGVAALLILFEFINLLIHPYVEHITHHSPFLMLIVLVFIASFLIPTHHSLEKWGIDKLLKKNTIIKELKGKKKLVVNE